MPSKRLKLNGLIMYPFKIACWALILIFIVSRQRLGKIDDEAEIKLGDNKIKKVSETKTLGVIVDDQLK